MAWLVIGSGLSGMEVAKFLRKRNEAVFLFDDNTVSPKKQSILLSLGVTIKEKVSNSFLRKNITHAIILSPSVPLDHPLALQAKRINIPLLSETELVLSYMDTKVLAITGTNGKSTTSSMAHHILTKLGYKAFLAGNIGVTLSSVYEYSPEVVVLELSSYQLEQATKIKASLAIFTTFSEDHLERHKNINSYFLAKWKLFDPKSSNISLAFFDQQIQKLVHKHCKPESFPVETNLITKQDLSLIKSRLPFFEPHNILNAALACKACMSLSKKNFVELADSLLDFAGLNHRFEKIGYLDKTQIINDSKATNLESTCAALEACENNIVLLLGGVSKVSDFSPLLKYKEKIKNIVCFGQDSSIIYNSLKNDFKIKKYSSLSSLLYNLYDIIEPEKPSTLLFSPACASFDEFNNFNTRGDFFKEWIKKYQKGSLCKTKSTSLI